MKTDSLIFYSFLFILPALLYIVGFSDQLIWDCRPVILENELLNKNVPIYKAFLSGYWQTTSQRLDGGYDYYRPLMIASFMLEKRLWGLDPFRLRMTNLLLFLFAGYLFYLILCRLGFALDVARYSTLLFVFHPLQLDNVNWIVGRCDLLMLLCAFSCWLLLDLFFQEQKTWQLTLGLLAFFLALLSKEAALFFLPFFGLIYSSKFRQRKFWLTLVLLIVLSAIFWILKSSVIGRAGFPIKFFLTLPETLQVLLGTIGYYTKTLLFPFGFVMFLPVDQVTARSYLIWGVFCILGLLLLGYFACKERKLALPFLMITIFLFFYLMMIFTPLFPFSISTRYLLFPAGGVCLLLGFSLNKMKKELSVVVLIMLLISFSLSILSRQFVYRSELNFWQNALAAAPENSFLLMKTAQQRFLKGELLAAEKLLQRALKQKMKPETAGAIAALLSEIKRNQAFYTEAKQWIERGLSLPVKGILRAQFWKESYRIALARGDLTAAEFSLAKINEQLPGNDLPAMLLDLYLGFGQWAKALQIISQIKGEERDGQQMRVENLQKNFSNYSLFERINYFERQGIYRLAYDCARKSEENDLRWQLNLIRLALLAGEEGDAHQLVEKLLFERKNDYRVLNSIGLIYLKLYRLADARNYFLLSLNLRSDQPDLIAQLKIIEKMESVD